MYHSANIIALLPFVLIVLVLGLGWFYMKQNYVGPNGRTIVRCRDGHLFTTIWIPFMSIKSIRLGPMRFQHCPVGDHWAFVVPVKLSDLSESEQEQAAQFQDRPIP